MSRPNCSNLFALLPRPLTVEHGIWIVVMLMASWSRFRDLGSRALHHDESLHTYYSWLLAEGHGYVHDPLMHGPFLFHANALMYWLFGATDTTSRILPALAGVALVGLPWFLRGDRFLGRVGAIATAILLLLSPSFLYYTRYIRHDSYMSASVLLLVVAIFRYLERSERRWMMVAFLSLAVALANHELIFAVLLAFVLYFMIQLLLGPMRILIPIQLATAGLTVLAYVTLFHRKDWPAIPWRNPSDAEMSQYYASLSGHPFVVIMILVVSLHVLASGTSIWWYLRNRGAAEAPLDYVFGTTQPGSVSHGLKSALRDLRGLAIGAAICMAMLILMFSTVFSNMRGLATATWATDGTLLYWLGQHDVRRGGQPWFYYLIEGAQYEWLGVCLTIPSVCLIIWYCIQWVRTGYLRPSLNFGLFCCWWFIFLFLVVSWAGEKMPWLIMHFALPGFLLAGMGMNHLLEHVTHWYWSRRYHTRLTGEFALVSTLVVLAVSWFLLAARMTWGRWPESVSHQSGQLSASRQDPDWWLLAVTPLFALFTVAFASWRIGPRCAGYAAITAAVLILTAGQIHQGFRMVYLDGDVAIDTLIYNTTTSDTVALANHLTDLSLATEGDLSLEITYDSCTAWPAHWYFREFTNDRVHTDPSPPASGGPAVIMGAYDPSRNCYMEESFAGYTTFVYVMRWHESEQGVYRNFALAPELADEATGGVPGVWSVLRSISESLDYALTQEGQVRLFRLVFFREQPAGTLDYRVFVHVRNDLVPIFVDFRYGP